MSFAWFRKYEKPFMWAAVIFTVAVFATFSGFSDLKALLSRQGADATYGQFELQATGQTKVIDLDEFQRVRLAMNRFAYASRSQDKITDNEVWAHIILREEARAADLDVSDDDVNDYVANAIGGGQPLTHELYTHIWRDILQFASAADMEDFLREQLEGSRWASFRLASAGLVTADEIYLQWRQDNEHFDYDALVIPDLKPEQVTDPSSDELKTMWDALSETVRAATYAEPRRVDIAYAWARLAPGEHGMADDKLAAEPDPAADEVESRFDMVKAERFPTAPSLTDEIRATLVRELKVMAVAQKAHDEFEASDDKGFEAFRHRMEAAGLTVEDPVGLLDNPALLEVPDIGGPMLSAWLGQTQVGGTVFGDPHWDDQDEVHVVLVQGEQPARPLSYEEAHDQLVKNWKQSRLDKPAREWREALRSAARELPECKAVIQPLLDAATTRADEAAAALADATDEARAARRKEVLDQAEAADILPRVKEFEHLVWDSVARPEGARIVPFAGIARSYRMHPSSDETATSIERRLKTAGEVFRLAVDSVSDTIRHAPTSESAAVIIRARSFPPQTDMGADLAGLNQSRTTLSRQRENEARGNFAPDAVAASHKLRVADISELKGQHKQVEVPPDA